MENQLRQKAKGLLESGEVKVLIGYGAGSVPFKSTPIFVRKPEDVDRLVWNPTCVNNLTVYLPNAVKSGKVAVVVKPCDAGSVVELIKEHQIKREDVMTIVVPCPGVTGGGPDESLALKCLVCNLGDPVIADVKIGEQPARNPVSSTAAEEYEKLSPAERRAFWAAQFEKCIRCYACREACPGCYCRECFVEKPGQLWVLRSTDPTSNWMFHMTRAMHLAGRCIACRECERACPMDIPLSLLGTMIEADVNDMFGYEPGDDPEALPVFGQFDLEKDPDPCPE
jgi:formate dehydrogenase subunit beta